MLKRFIAAACALVLATGAQGGVHKVPAPSSAGGVTTLSPDASPSLGGEPTGGWQWQGGAPPADPFTSVAVIKDGSLASADGANATIPLVVPNELGAPPPGAAAPAKDGKASARGVLAHMPEPSTWVLLLLGLAMIGFAIRGLVAANRRLARLKAPEN